MNREQKEKAKEIKRKQVGSKIWTAAKVKKRPKTTKIVPDKPWL